MMATTANSAHPAGDGIIEHIFSVVGDGPGLCSEFGAWDGIHFSNSRALVERAGAW
jgi:hypothetical protein